MSLSLLYVSHRTLLSCCALSDHAHSPGVPLRSPQSQRLCAVLNTRAGTRAGNVNLDGASQTQRNDGGLVGSSPLIGHNHSLDWAVLFTRLISTDKRFLKIMGGPTFTHATRHCLEKKQFICLWNREAFSLSSFQPQAKPRPGWPFN